MGSASTTGRAIACYIGPLVLTLLSAFLIFYTVRLLYVTRALSAIRAGGQGAYVGAVTFALLALMLSWSAWRLLRADRRA